MKRPGRGRLWRCGDGDVDVADRSCPHRAQFLADRARRVRLQRLGVFRVLARVGEQTSPEFHGMFEADLRWGCWNVNDCPLVAVRTICHGHDDIRLCWSSAVPF